MLVSDKELRQLSPVAARQKILEAAQTHSPTQIARLFAMSRTTLYIYTILARYQQRRLEGLADQSRRPKTPAGQTPAPTEKIIVLERARTGFGPRRMKAHLPTKAQLTVPESTLRNIFRRHRLTRKPKRRHATRAFNLEALYPLQRFQVDLKHILDFSALPPAVYSHAVRRGLPPYQWTAIDTKTRLRFLACSYEKTATNGLFFMQTVALWLRAFGVSHRLDFQTDWGEEFGGKSPRKLAQLQQELFDPLAVLRTHIHKGQSQENAFVERSHRPDDEEFYIPWLAHCPHTENFLYRAFHSRYTYNTARPHQGRGMDHLTPWQKLKTVQPHSQPQIAAFPPLLLDPLSSRHLIPTLTSKTVQHLPAPYQNSDFLDGLDGEPRLGSPAG